jgi:hypothetical protein
VKKVEKKGKNIAFTSNTDSEEANDDLDTRGDLSDEVVLLGKQFNKILKRVDRRSRRNVEHIQPNISTQGNTSAKPLTEKEKDVRCFECEGYGHIRTECATFLKKQKKGLAISWSDGENSDNESEDMAANHVRITTDASSSDNESSDDELTYKEVVSMNNDLFLKSEELCRTLVEQHYDVMRLKREKQELQEKISILQEEIKQLSFDTEMKLTHPTPHQRH